MITIIKEGNVKQYRAKCATCGCEYNFEEGDLEYGVGGRNCPAIRCPCCRMLSAEYEPIKRSSRKAKNPPQNL